jgi:hypothetical protein
VFPTVVTRSFDEKLCSDQDRGVLHISSLNVCRCMRVRIGIQCRIEESAEVFRASQVKRVAALSVVCRLDATLSKVCPRA